MTTQFTLGRSFRRHALGLALLGCGLAAHAACDTSTPIFLSQGSGGLTSLRSSPATLPVSFANLGASATRTYNALGYNPSDDKLYGVSNSGHVLLEINQANGATTDLGAITGLPSGLGAFNSGAFSDAGDYYAKPTGNNTQLYKIDVTTRAATLIALSRSFTTSDMAWVNGLMYTTADNGQLYSIDVTNGTTTPIGGPDSTGGVLGAQFSGTNGLFGSANNGSGLYRINLTTGRRDKISDTPASGANDGASCPTVALFEPLPEEPELPVNPEPAPPTPTPVPTLDLAGLGLLSLLGAGAGALGLRRRQRRAGK